MKLHSLALHALVTPVIALGAGSVLAQQPGQDSDREQQSTQRDQDARSTQHDQDAAQSTSRTTQSDQSTERSSRSEERGNQSAERARQADSQSAADRRNTRDQNRGYLDSAPANSMQASNLIGARVRTTSDEDVGSVSDLIIDENGQVVAVVLGTGGFLGLGEKNVAIGWDDVTRSGASDERSDASDERSGASDERESDEQESDQHELRIQATREDLRSAPEFERQD